VPKFGPRLLSHAVKGRALAFHEMPGGEEDTFPRAERLGVTQPELAETV
jgi:hypothetical protein